MYKLVILACVFAAANAGLIGAPYAGLGYAGAPLGYAGAYAGAPLGYAGAYAGLPLGYAGAPLAAAPLAAAPLAFAAPQAYALPAVREIAEAPIVEQAVEKVEQHGYSIRY